MVRVLTGGVLFSDKCLYYSPRRVDRRALNAFNNNNDFNTLALRRGNCGRARSPAARAEESGESSIPESRCRARGAAASLNREVARSRFG